MRPASAQQPTVTVELFGVPQLLAQTRQVELSAATLHELAQQLATRLPALAGSVVDRATGWLLPGYIFVVDGRFTRDPNYQLARGARVLLVAAQAGGM